MRKSENQLGQHGSMVAAFANALSGRKASPYFFVLDDGNRMLHCSKELSTALGYRDGQTLLGKPLHELLAAETADHVLWSAGEFTLPSGITRCHRLRSRSGKTINLDLTAYELPLQSGSLTFVVAQKAAAPAPHLAQPAQPVWIDAALQAARIGGWEWNLATGQVNWNNVEPIFGLSAGSFSGSFQAYQQLILEEDRPQVLATIERCLQDPSADDSFRVVYRIRRPDGAIRWLEGTGRAERDQHGKPTRMVGMVVDITEQHLSREARRDSEARLKSVVDTIPGFVITADRDGTILFINRMLSEFRSADVIGKKIYDFTDPAYHSEIRHRLAVVFATQQPQQYETQGVGPHGTVAWYLTRLGPVFKGNEVISATLTSIDITATKRFEDAIKRLAEHTQKAGRARLWEQLVSSLGEAIGVNYCFIGLLAGAQHDRVETQAVHAKNRIADNFVYDLADTPCEVVLNSGTCIYPHNVRALFPNDRLIAEMDIESYGGHPLRNSTGQTIGILVVADNRPLPYPDLVFSLIQIYGAQAAMELERDDLYARLQAAAAGAGTMPQ